MDLSVDGSNRGGMELDCQGGQSAGLERSISGGFWNGSVDAPDVTFRPQDGIGGWGIRGQVIIPGCLSRRVCGANGG